MKRIDRRTMLRGMGGVAIALPFLEAMGCGTDGKPVSEPIASRSDRTEDGLPKRFVAMFSGNGTENTYAQWTPHGGESDFTLHGILEPLTPHRSDIIVFSGLANEVSYKGPGDAHQRGMGSMLTGRALLEGDFPGNDGQTAGYASGISVDQEIANHIGKSTKFPSLEYSVQNNGVTVYARMSYKASNQPLPPENNPAAMFGRVFADFDADAAVVAQNVLRRRSVLDAVLGDFNSLSARVGSKDRARLDLHAESIRSIERRLDTTASTAASAMCKKPVKKNVAFMDPMTMPEVAKLQIDLLVMALACDLTRVSTLQIVRANNNFVFGFLGIPDAHHDLSHHGDSDAVANQKLTKINKWFAEQYAYLLASLKAIPEGSGTMLDNCAVLWCNEQGKGNNHSRKDMPWVLAGRAGGAFRTGRFINAGGAPHNRLLLSLLSAFGIDAKVFGDPDFCGGGPLSKLA